ncbi:MULTISPECIES: DUF2878 domain-containing protein [Marinobacter]|jgi:hypothetical protein|uniref:DUF2878 domain-containing protein n=1 Tax=Marinobacter TaxID=2742 RepID=UPI00200565D2|nr:MULTISPECIES: DUF2878 domain-containing protein [Marinobacter]MCK7550121.1 DUF2878 domain-containing protein [Marinobacter goseongensis]MDV3503637.1 DUF2878 domain-containing protein [Marinobacter sp. M-5]
MIQSRTLRNVINFVLFQAGWLICILYPGMMAAGVVALFLVIHFTLISQNRWMEAQFIGFGTVIGGVLDGIWFNTGILDDGTGQVVITPIWLIAIWAIFMTTLSHSLQWISSKPWLPWVLAPITGPFTYWSASQLGAVELPVLTTSLLALAVGWLAVFPMLLYVRNSLYTELAS